MQSAACGGVGYGCGVHQKERMSCLAKIELADLGKGKEWGL